MYTMYMCVHLCESTCVCVRVHNVCVCVCVCTCVCVCLCVCILNMALCTYSILMQRIATSTRNGGPNELCLERYVEALSHQD